jgi:dTDP-4-dehydrorhamnose 3,5-epimerase
MIFHATELRDAFLIEVELKGDERGSFARTMCRSDFEAHGLVGDYVQQNMSVSARRGTIRGLHFQRAPDTEAKLVRCVRGAIVDVIIDLRRSSPTFLRHQMFELSDAGRTQLYVPPGLAHGFQTLTDDVEISYLVSAAYTPRSEGGIRYDDPLLAIAWPLPASAISAKDAAWPLLNPHALETPFR